MYDRFMNFKGKGIITASWDREANTVGYTTYEKKLQPKVVMDEYIYVEKI